MSCARRSLLMLLHAIAAQPVRAETDTLPGMPPVVDPQNLYSEAGAGHVSPRWPMTCRASMPRASDRTGST